MTITTSLQARAARSPLPLLVLALAAACHGPRDGAPRLVAETSALHATELAAGLDAPLDVHSNLLWCASLPLAWQELERLLGGPPRLGGSPPELAWLNATRVDPADVDPSARVARAGFTRDGIVAEIQRDLVRTFGRRDPALDQLVSSTQAVALAYARLEKALRFEVAFEDLEDAPLTFRYRESGEERTRTVDAFGVDGLKPSRPRHRKLQDQVHVRHYAAADDFVVQLLAEDSTDVLLVARVPAAETLGATWEAVRTRIEGAEPERLAPGEWLAVPELDFDLQHRFTGLEGRAFENPGFEGLPLLAVGQDLRLRLDERGMVLRSTTRAMVGSAVSIEPRRLIVDGPFLVAAIERDASTPYLLAWIGHPELLTVAR